MRWAKYVYYIALYRRPLKTSMVYYIAKRQELGKEEGTTPKNTIVALQEENVHKHLNFTKRKYANF